MWSDRNGGKGERKQYVEGLTVVSLVMCIESCAVDGMAGGGDMCDGFVRVAGVEERVQQRHMRQTCVNTVVRYEHHAGVPNPKGKSKAWIIVKMCKSMIIRGNATTSAAIH